MNQKQPPEMFCKKVFLKISLTEKHLFRSLYNSIISRNLTTNNLPTKQFNTHTDLPFAFQALTKSNLLISRNIYHRLVTKMKDRFDKKKVYQLT